jgi:hypothetical protein
LLLWVWQVAGEVPLTVEIDVTIGQIHVGVDPYRVGITYPWPRPRWRTQRLMATTVTLRLTRSGLYEPGEVYLRGVVMAAQITHTAERYRALPADLEPVRFQGVVATAWASFLDGVIQPRVCRGRVLSE